MYGVDFVICCGESDDADLSSPSFLLFSSNSSTLSSISAIRPSVASSPSTCTPFYLPYPRSNTNDNMMPQPRTSARSPRDRTYLRRHGRHCTRDLSRQEGCIFLPGREGGGKQAEYHRESEHVPIRTSLVFSRNLSNASCSFQWRRTSNSRRTRL